MAGESVHERAEALANRVRLAQAEGEPSDGPVVSAVAAAVSESIAGLGSTEANAVLREAERLVPGWSAGRALTGVDGSVTVVAAAELGDASFLAEELAAAASALDEEERRRIGALLAAAGVSSAEATEAGAEALARAATALGVKDAGSLDAGRLAEGLALSMETVKTLDTLAWRTWRTLATNSSIRCRGDLHVLLGRYVSGQGGESAETVGADFAKFRQLVASLLASMGQVGDVAYRRVSTLSPLHIESLAGAEKGAMETQEAACWRKYRELASQLDEATVQGETMRAISTIAEGLMTS